MTTIVDIHWTEKYRPETLDGIIGNEPIVAKLREWAESGDTPNLCFAGPAGTGKTSLAVAFARDLYGDDWRQNFRELNASDDRGIDVVRNHIKRFAEQGAVGGHDYKLIFLDEADSLTPEAQAALRRVMEQYADRTRFILSCNYLRKLIDPIQSRCVMFSVSPLTSDTVFELLQTIADAEGVDYTDEALQMVADYSQGDARRAINTLQAATVDGSIRSDDAIEVMTVIDDDDVQEMLVLAMGGKLSEAQDLLSTKFLKEGVDPQSLASTVFEVLKRVEMPSDSRILAIHKLAECEYRITQGSLPHVQWSAFLADMQAVRHLSFEEGWLREKKGEKG